MTGELRGLTLIESITEVEPFQIVPISQRCGTVVSAEDAMVGRVKWAERAGYTVLTRDVPHAFAPYNAVIRISERGTEDTKRDYLAEIM
jgi:hypothetical protein